MIPSSRFFISPSYSLASFHFLSLCQMPYMKPEIIPELDRQQNLNGNENPTPTPDPSALKSRKKAGDHSQSKNNQSLILMRFLLYPVSEWKEKPLKEINGKPKKSEKRLWCQGFLEKGSGKEKDQKIRCYIRCAGQDDLQLLTGKLKMYQVNLFKTCSPTGKTQNRILLSFIGKKNSLEKVQLCLLGTIVERYFSTCLCSGNEATVVSLDLVCLVGRG